MAGQPAYIKAFIASLLLTGCSAAPYKVNQQDLAPNETEWINTTSTSVASIDISRVIPIDESLSRLFSDALKNNANWQASLSNLKQAELNLITNGANRFPQVSLSASAISNGSNDKTIATNHNQSGQLATNWEIDVWGKLSDQQKSAELTFQSTQVKSKATKQALLITTAQTWLNTITAKQLLTLYEKRLVSLNFAQDIIEKGYQRGLNSALELNLGRNTLASEKARTEQQKQSLLEYSANLQTLIGKYPTGKLDINSALPEPNPAYIQVLPPAKVLEQRHDLQAAWLNLLAANVNVAVAHKRRFPSFNLNAIVSKSPSTPSAWSLISSLTVPLFDAGKLKTEEKIAAIRVQELEANYLQTLRDALAEVETTIAKANNLTQRYQTEIQVNETAQLSYELAQRQYQLGLATFSTLLEAQRRAFDAEASLIQLQNQWAQNQFKLAQAIGLEMPTSAQEGNTL